MTLKFNTVLEVVEVHVRAKFHHVQRFMSYQQCTRFWTTLDFDRECLWKGSSNQPAENGVINYDFLHVRPKQFGELWSTNGKMNLTLKFNRVRAVVKIYVRAKFHQTGCSGS